MKNLLRFLFGDSLDVPIQVVTKLAHDLFDGSIRSELVQELGDVSIGFCLNCDLILFVSHKTGVTQFYYNGELIKFESDRHAQFFHKLFLDSRLVEVRYLVMQVTEEEQYYHELESLFPLTPRKCSKSPCVFTSS